MQRLSLALVHELRDHRRHAVEKQLRREISGEVRFDRPSRLLYSTDASIYQIEPFGAVLPRTQADLHAAVQILLEHRIPMVPRGGGTSLSGQAVGPGVVVDCSKYLHRIIEIDWESRRVRVEPGVVLEQLNRALASAGFMFGPDVSTASRACLGGMIGNNSAGAHSIVYGKTVDHVHSLEMLLADGTRRRFMSQALPGPVPVDVQSTMLLELLRNQHHEIRRRFPRILRRVSGYNLDSLLDQSETKELNLAALMVGSEGTLGFIAEAELRMVPRPRHRALLLPHFSSLPAALDCLAACLEAQPTAVELIDALILDLARDNLALQRRMQPIAGRPAAVLLIEFAADKSGEVQAKLDKLGRKLERAPGVTHVVRVRPEDREPLWRLRESGLPLLMGLPGDRKPITFVEDCAVAPEKLPEFTERFQEIIQRHGTFGAFYGHASVGCLHIRPVLNLKEASDVRAMRQISQEVSDLVLEFGGSLSGEHGDGLARSMWMRKMFGDEIYAAFKQVKRIFDPENLFNPGKIVDAPEMTENLRFGPAYRPAQPDTVLDFSRHGGMTRHVELCSGTGVCRRLNDGVMCPSYRATREERDSTRGRANALRLALVGEEPLKELRSDWVAEVLDLCLSCKACKSECPSNVDMAALKAEAAHQRLLHRSGTARDWLLGHLHQVFRMAAPLAGFLNAAGRVPLVRWLMEKGGGIDRRRSLPPLQRSTFRHWFARQIPPVPAGRRSAVVLLADCFTNYTEPALGRAAVKVLEAAGYSISLAEVPCCGRTLISKGFLGEARDLVAEFAPRLARDLPENVPLLGLEPSCLLSFVDEWPRLISGEATRHIANAASLLDGWIAQEVQRQALSLPFQPMSASCIVHGHCHQKALVGMEGTVAALGLIPRLQIHVPDMGCCGMAGAFGYERDHYEISLKIAKLSLAPLMAAEDQALLIAPGTSCRHQIQDVVSKQAMHPIQLLAQSLRGNESSVS